MLLVEEIGQMKLESFLPEQKELMRLQLARDSYTARQKLRVSSPSG